jgi:hypothetical protein
MEFEADPQNSTIDPKLIDQLIHQPLYAFAASDPAGFTEQLAAAALPVGGIAVRGGERLVVDLISSDFDDPNYHAILDAALTWLHDSGASRAQLTGYESRRWNATHNPDVW